MNDNALGRLKHYLFVFTAGQGIGLLLLALLKVSRA